MLRRPGCTGGPKCCGRARSHDSHVGLKSNHRLQAMRIQARRGGMRGKRGVREEGRGKRKGRGSDKLRGDRMAVGAGASW
eukprot:765591-Hanusia_phi.AAC.4